MKTSSIEARASRGSALFSFASVNFLPGALERALDDLAPEAAELRLRRLARRAADRGARAPGHDDAVPRGGRRAALGARDLHLVAVVQRRDQRRDAAVDLRADRGIADIGVDGVGEVDRGRAARQRDQAPLGREAEHLILKQFELGVLEESSESSLASASIDLPQSAIGAALADVERVGVRPSL